MISAIIFKEWLKTRAIFAVAFILVVAIAVHDILAMNKVVALRGVEHLWMVMMLKDNIFVNTLRFIPLLIGIKLGFSQMLPEMTQSRLKLTLHLPFPQDLMILVMLLVGFTEMVVLSALAIGIIYLYDIRIFAPELVARVLLTTLPWFLCGISAYFLSVAVCLERVWRRKVFLSLLGIGIVFLYFVQSAPEAYNSSLWGFALLSLASALLVYYTVYRFKEGR